MAHRLHRTRLQLFSGNGARSRRGCPPPGDPCLHSAALRCAGPWAWRRDAARLAAAGRRDAVPLPLSFPDRPTRRSHILGVPGDARVAPAAPAPTPPGRRPGRTEAGPPAEMAIVVRSAGLRTCGVDPTPAEARNAVVLLAVLGRCPACPPASARPAPALAALLLNPL